jgi:hypothetical protein
LKKKQKLMRGCRRLAGGKRAKKSFLVLFFKKEPLASLPGSYLALARLPDNRLQSAQAVRNGEQ